LRTVHWPFPAAATALLPVTQLFSGICFELLFLICNTFNMMRKILFLLFLFSTLASYSSTSKDSTAHRTRFFILGGITWSAIDLNHYNITDPKPGLNARIYSYLKSNVRLAGEYTYALKHNDPPTWTNVVAQNAELNVHITGTVNNTQLAFYALTGASMQFWKGEFTGIADQAGVNVVVDAGEIESYTSFLANFGCGFEKNFRHFGFFGEFKFRLNQSDSNVKIKINDVVYGAGVKVNIRMKNINKLFRKPGDVYHWF